MDCCEMISWLRDWGKAIEKGDVSVVAKAGSVEVFMTANRLKEIAGFLARCEEAWYSVRRWLDDVEEWKDGSLASSSSDYMVAAERERIQAMVLRNMALLTTEWVPEARPAALEGAFGFLERGRALKRSLGVGLRSCRGEPCAPSPPPSAPVASSFRARPTPTARELRGARRSWA